MGRKILAVVAGLVTGFILAAIFETIGTFLYPPPPELDRNNVEQMSAYIQTLPIGAFLILLAAWTTATFGGGVVTWTIAKEKPMLFASIIGIILLAASIFNFVMIPHPTWFAISAVLGIILAAFLAGKVGQCKYAKPPTATP